MAEWVERLCSEREILSSNPGILPLLSSACRECDGPPCHIHNYTVYMAWAAMPYTQLYSVYPYWWKRQMSHQTWLSGSQQARKSAGEIHSGFETHEEGHTESKTGAISGSTKWALVQQIFKKKSNILSVFTENCMKTKKFWHWSGWCVPCTTLHNLTNTLHDVEEFLNLLAKLFLTT